MAVQVKNVSFVYQRLYELGVEIYHQRHKNKLKKDDYMDFILHNSIEEVIRKAKEITDQNFTNLIYWRLMDFLKNPKRETEIDSDQSFDISNATEKEGIKLGRLSALFRQLEETILNPKTSRKTIRVKLEELVLKYGITKFLGIPIDTISETVPNTRQGKEHHIKKFSRYVSDYKNLRGESVQQYFPQKIVNFSKDKTYLSLPEEIRELQDYATARKRDGILLAKSLKIESVLENSRFSSLICKNDMVSILFLALVNYLEAALFFKEVCSWNLEFWAGKYNYAFCLKRLGQNRQALEAYKECLSILELGNKEDRNKFAITYEAVAEMYLLENEINLAIENYKKAIEINPLDEDLHKGLMHCYSL